MNQPVNFLGALGVLPDPLGAMQIGEERAIINDARRTQTQAYRDMVREKVEAARAARERQGAFAEAIGNLDPTDAAGAARVMMAFPEFAEQIKGGYQVADEDARRQDMMYTGQLYGQLRAGDIDGAIMLARQRYDSEKAQGLTDEGDDAFISALESRTPEGIRSAMSQLQAFLAANNPEKFAEAFGGLRKEERDSDLHPATVQEANAKATTATVEAQYAPQAQQANLDNIQSQIADRKEGRNIDRQRLTLDRKRLQFDIDKAVADLTAKGTEIDPNSLKTMTDAVTASQESFALADQTSDLADRFVASNATAAGGFAGLAEWGAKTFGRQDIVSEIRTEYKRLRNSTVIKGLPPGAASDTDIAAAMEGYPPSTASKEYMARFLRGMSKLQRLEANAKAAQADWISENGNLGKAKRDLVVNGTRVPAGTSFAEFSGSGAALRRGREQSPAVQSLLEKYGQ